MHLEHTQFMSLTGDQLSFTTSSCGCNLGLRETGRAAHFHNNNLGHVPDYAAPFLGPLSAVSTGQ